MDFSKDPIIMTDTSAQNGQRTSPPPRFEGKPYLQCLDTLEDAFPALKSFLEKLANEGEAGRQAVRQHYEKEHQRTPGRCYCLEFKAKSVVEVEKGGFKSAAVLREYLKEKPANKSREERHKRLFILEDMEPDYVDALGHHLGVDPLVFSEQMNTWNRIAIDVSARAVIHAALLRIADFALCQVAVILVDPAFATACEPPKTESASGGRATGVAASECLKNHEAELDPSARKALDDCLILQDPTIFPDRSELWKAQDHNSSRPPKLEAVSHQSWPYHYGCSTLAPLMFSEVGLGTKEMNLPMFQQKRNLTSAMEEIAFHWTKLATPDLIQQTNLKSSNAAYYLLKHVAQHWVNQLELMNTTIARAEWFADDYQAKIDDNLTKKKWKSDLLEINEIAKDINYMRRHLNHFWRAMYLNLERLGVQLGDETVTKEASLAIKHAQKDFLTIHTRMQPLRDRAEALNSVSNDLANLRAAFRGVSDGEFGLRLSLFASIVFPLTLLAGIFSMGDDFRPGRKQFWQLWAIGIPVCVVVALGLVYGRRPWAVATDLWEYVRSWFEHYGLMKPKEKNAAQKQKIEGTQMKEKRTRKQGGRASLVRRTGWNVRDEEHGVDD
ncbi:uncharacterized protein J4E79_001155 [Alternaria viburni]|uniref:uncharacterized protein n=1 Tax=Alternaria viburni TaxID=566460 RepID=UPI0020C272C9|nr:uncharacterized protein J4E79_001155 [Alternaria viburni]KAI4669112.1 hypothetical protein J4E79_001155 [Alternaria viburni]